MARTGILRQVGIGIVALVSATMILGGCNKANKDLEAAQAESAELREKVATLDQSNRDKDGKIAELQTSLANCQSTQKPVDMGGEEKPTGKKPKNSDEKTSKGTGERFTLSGDVLFEPGQATLKAGAKKAIDTVIAEIKSKHKSGDIRVEGHTDSDPIKKSKFASNQALSEARAEAVRKYMISKGIAASRIEAVGYGAKKPLKNKAASRRVEIVVAK
jgi:chemotaxis protein MotB